MQMAIRALGWATKLLWIILVVTVITIAYSATQINIAFGEPQATATQQTITISFPIEIRNNGLYDLTQLNITTRITDQDSQTLAEGTTISRLIQRGTVQTTTHTVAIDTAQILQQSSNLLFNDTTLTIFQYVSLNYANAVPFTVHGNYTMSWGAPLSNLAVGSPSYRLYNTTHSIATIQLYFENHNQYVPVTGTTRIEIYNTRQSLKGVGTASIDAQPNTPCSMQIDVLVSNSRSITTRGEVRLFFETSAFKNDGPMVMPYG